MCYNDIDNFNYSMILFQIFNIFILNIKTINSIQMTFILFKFLRT